MNETKRSSLERATTMSRRGFVKAAAAAGAVGVAAGSMASTSSWFAPAKALAEPECLVTLGVIAVGALIFMVLSNKLVASDAE